MNEKSNVTEQPVTSAEESGDIMQHIQDMIGDLLKNAVDKMHKEEIGKQLGDTPTELSDENNLPMQMGITEIKNFVGVMQKFIDNVNVIILQLETGSIEQGDQADMFLDGYMATADNVLEMAAYSMKDATTGLSNRYGFDNRMVLEWNRATRDKSTLGLVIFTVDCIKTLEDDKKRDDMLKAVSKTLENSIKRSTDFIARWNDDEFAALLPITNASGASIVAERIRVELGSLQIPGGVENGEESSISIGVCVHTPEVNEKPAEFINRTYDAFEQAKETDGSSIVFA